MKTYELFKEYIWLVDLLKTYKRLSFAEINEEWVQTEMSGGVKMTRSTFNRHKDAIEDILGLYIECDRSDGYVYYIGNEDVLYGDTIQKWMLSTLCISNTINENKQLYDRILLDDTPHNEWLLEEVMEAMRKCVKIIIGYKKYDFRTLPKVLIEPFCLKMFKNHWYLLGRVCRKVNGKIKHEFSLFSLHKIISVEFTDEKFALPADFDAESYFANYFGVIVYDGTKAEKVKIRAFGSETEAMDLHPLHKSQKRSRWTNEYTDYSYFICPTTDFRDYLIGRGSRIKVLSPQWLADEIKYKHLEAAKAYTEETND